MNHHNLFECPPPAPILTHIKCCLSECRLKKATKNQTAFHFLKCQVAFAEKKNIPVISVHCSFLKS